MYCRVADSAYEQLQLDRGSCTLVQKYTPQLVQQRVLGSPQATAQVLVRFLGPYAPLVLKPPSAALKACRERICSPSSSRVLVWVFLRTSATIEPPFLLQGRGFEIIFRLGLYFGGLAIDYLSGEVDSTEQVKFRAAQLRCVSTSPPHPPSFQEVFVTFHGERSGDDDVRWLSTGSYFAASYWLGAISSWNGFTLCCCVLHSCNAGILPSFVSWIQRNKIVRGGAE